MDMVAEQTIKTWKIRVYGIVQGVGFRPTVSRHAQTSGIRGSVCNCGPFVEIILQGTPAQKNQFLMLLKTQPPKRAVIMKTDVEELRTEEVSDGFEIVESEKTSGAVFISPDIAICEECKEELYDPANRRYLHPFINCTCCGPRLTILDALPYDRERTSMKAFPMCAPCADEYTSPASRRYDAQPVCCPDCGPQVYFLETKKNDLGCTETGVQNASAVGAPAIRRAREILAEGGILAVKGIGGFHLCCDAANEASVQRMRREKGRPMKPLAVMMKDLKTAKRECIVEPFMEEVLTGHQKPIILMRKQEHGSVAPSVAPDNPKLGVMLPYAPVQLLLFDSQDDLKTPEMLVMTSGNASGAPICRTDEDALQELAGLCDGILSNDREIRLRADDTVMDFYEEQPYMIRRSRGYAPLPVMISEIAAENKPARPVLAVGGELKNTVCIGNGDLLYMSPYIGDLADLRTVKASAQTVQRFMDLLEAEPQMVACDMHPKYNSVAMAKDLGLPMYEIQHHYAHILSCMAENDYTGRVIGVSMDGTGYGTDQTIWGGELLLCDPYRFTRFGSIEPFPQSGGDLAAKEGWRVAAGMLAYLSAEEADAAAAAEILHICTAKELHVIKMMAARGINTVTSTSAGRLFDAVSAVLGIRRNSTFEGEASTALQFQAEAFAAKNNSADKKQMLTLFERKLALLCAKEAQQRAVQSKENLENDTEKRYFLPTAGLFLQIVEMKKNGTASDALAWYFHAALARLIAEGCSAAREVTKISTAALSGGCYQNLLLLDMTIEELKKRDFTVLRHRLIPPNDGGIALGQAFGAMAYGKRMTEMTDKE